MVTAVSNWMQKVLKDPAMAGLLEQKTKAVTFTIDPESWPSADISAPFLWKHVEFDRKNAKSIPPIVGLYAFVLRLPYPGLPPHGWVLYIGQTGDSDSQQNLRQRFANYIAEQKKPKRMNVYFMLNAWKDDLLFFYTELPTRKHELLSLETKLLDAFRPPFSRGGYTASIMKPRAAY